LNSISLRMETSLAVGSESQFLPSRRLSNLTGVRNRMLCTYLSRNAGRGEASNSRAGVRQSEIWMSGMKCTCGAHRG